jgi:MoaA/NifB/PqqE/SkfB family radical SAM enzyme
MDTFRSLEPIMDHVEEVTLMGWGEPTVNPGFADMLKTVADHGARAYFCTNGMRLDVLTDVILSTKVEVFAVSVDGATPESNDRIRRGSDLTRICASLKNLFRTAEERGQKPPWVNFVMCAMRENIAELPGLVRLASQTGVPEVKVVFLTAFDDERTPSVLWEREDEIRAAFAEAMSEAERLGVALKLPYVPGEDPAGTTLHRPCFTPWRDFFLGSDGFVRPCMSTSQKLFRYDPEADFQKMWNAPEFQELRATVNSEGSMPAQCTRCYQSSHCNWNLKSSFLQVGEDFSPEWE